MKVRRTLPPAAAPLGFQDLWNGLKGFLAGQSILDEFGDDIREYFGTRHVFLVSSGKAAMYMILKAMKSLRPGRSEVIIPAYTCYSVPSAIVKAGLDVALCDVDASSLDFDIGLLGKTINENTLCIIPNHLFGIPSRLGEIAACVKDKEIFILEDAAQAMGIRNGPGLLGTFGDAGLFSLGRGKSITCGGGGIIVTNSDTMAGAVRKEYDAIDYPARRDTIYEFIKTALMSIFVHPYLYWIPSSMPFLGLGRTRFDTRFPVKKLSALQAGLGKHWRQRLENGMSVRKKQAELLCNDLKICSDAGLNRNLPYLRLPYLTISREQKARVFEMSRNEGLGISQMYPAEISAIPQLAHKFSAQSFPAARYVADRLITLPVHKYVKESDRAKMARLLSSCRRSQIKVKDKYPLFTPFIPGPAVQEDI